MGNPFNVQGMSSAVAPRYKVQVRPAGFFGSHPRYANVGEQAVTKFEKMPALARSFPLQCFFGQPYYQNGP